MVGRAPRPSDRVNSPKSARDENIEESCPTSRDTMNTPNDPIRLDVLSDSALLRAYRASKGRDRSVLEKLLIRHENRMFVTCLRIVGDRETARDLTQETFAHVIQGLDGFDDRARFTTWITRIAMNCCLSHLRREKVRKQSSLDSPATRRTTGGMPIAVQQSVEQAPERRIELEEDLARLAAAMRRMDVEQRAILVLRDVQGLEYREIAEVLGIAVGTVKSRLFRARAALRREMEVQEDQAAATRRGGTDR